MNYLRLTPQRKPTIRGLAAARQKKGGDIAPLRGAKKRFATKWQNRVCGK